MTKLTTTQCFLISILLFSLFLIHIESKNTLQEEEDDHNQQHAIDDHLTSSNEDEADESASTFLLRNDHALRQKMRTRMLRLTCHKFPRICKTKGSPGSHCCKNKCVDVLTNRHNCGKCGKKCKYSQICCKGKCVSPSFNRNHCGGCSNRCNVGGFCAFGLCNYA